MKYVPYGAYKSGKAGYERKILLRVVMMLKQRFFSFTLERVIGPYQLALITTSWFLHLLILVSLGKIPLSVGVTA